MAVVNGSDRNLALISTTANSSVSNHYSLGLFKTSPKELTKYKVTFRENVGQN
jgi:hypothetical protein